jgi:hypothetical protein
MPSLHKVEYCNLPVRIPVAWRGDLEDKAEKLGITVNAALRLALKIGAPVLGTYIRVLQKTVKSNCRQLERTPSIKLALPRHVVPEIQRAHGKRKSKSATTD